MSRTRRSRVAIATFCALSLVAAACGGDDDTTSDTEAPDAAETTAAAAETTAATETSASETTAAAETTEAAAVEPTGEATGTPVKIALLYSETGRTASAYGMTNDVAEAWAEHVNANKAGIGGHPVEIVALDVQSDVAVAAEKAREAVETEGVVGVIIQDSNTETAVREYLNGAGVPVIGGTSNAWAPEIPDTEFTVSSTPPGSYGLSVLAASAVGAKAFGSIACSEVPTCATGDPFYAELVPANDMTYAPLVLASHTEASYTAQCLTMINAGVDYLPLGFAPAVAGIVAAECYLQGFAGYIGGTANTVDEDTVRASADTIPGYKMAGYINGFPWWADDPAVEEYRTVTEGLEAPTKNPSATITWASLEMLRSVFNGSDLEADAEITAADVIAAYQTISDESLDGLVAQAMDFTSGPAPVPCGWLFKFEDGEFSTLTVGDSGNGASGDLQSSCAVVE
ncbi:MAG: ABC transporter substrate-binding protein [Acidimicrobiia bacterium]